MVWIKWGTIYLYSWTIKYYGLIYLRIKAYLILVNAFFRYIKIYNIYYDFKCEKKLYLKTSNINSINVWSICLRQYMIAGKCYMYISIINIVHQTQLDSKNLYFINFIYSIIYRMVNTWKYIFTLFSTNVET